jgi:hypothetical protein
MTRLRRTLPVVLFGALVLLIGGCDSAGTGGGDDTITLNENSGLEPVPYVLSYSEGDYQNGEVVVTAGAQTPLGDRLQDLGYRPSDVTSAQITAVTILRRSPGTAAVPTQKVFPYLSRAELYLGGADGVRVASREPVPTPDRLEPVAMDLDNEAGDVTSFVRNETTAATLRLQLDTPADIGGAGETDEIEVEITYSVTVPLN